MLDKIPNWLLTVLVLLGIFLFFYSGINIGLVLLILGAVISIGMAIFDKKEKG